MSERLQAILFLGFIILFILGFVFSLFYIIIKSLNSTSRIKQLASRYDWYYYKNDKEHSESLLHLKKKLEETFYKTRSGLAQNISQIINGHYNGIEFWFAHYHAHSRNHISGKGYSQNLSIFILPRVISGPDLLLLHKTRMMKLIPIEQISRVLGGNLEEPDSEEREWLLTSDKTALKNMGLTSAQYREMENDFRHMYGIYFLDGIVVYMIQNYRSSKDIINFLDNIYRINSIVNL